GEQVWDKVKEMVTDPARVRRSDLGHPEVCSVYAYHEVFTPEEKDQIGEDCRKAAIGCVDCKKNLAASIDSLLEPMRERRAAFGDKSGAIDEIIHEGNARARATAAETMTVVREVLNLPE
ncbi:tryptophan--tRNA ligase, partial [Candidatus Sumerlaeota bacterium]|nr:tryptophan--tRNA ligase [Candidatus Sumerlaeota bacterium]